MKVFKVLKELTDGKMDSTRDHALSDRQSASTADQTTLLHSSVNNESL